jgi:hypothetical protein
MEKKPGYYCTVIGLENKKRQRPEVGVLGGI